MRVDTRVLVKVLQWVDMVEGLRGLVVRATTRRVSSRRPRGGVRGLGDHPVSRSACLLVEARQERSSGLASLAGLPLLHPEGLWKFSGARSCGPLRRLVKQRSPIVKRRTAVLQRLDALLELLGTAWYGPT